MNSYLIVGTGFAGSTYARKLAEAGHKVTMIDRRDHVAGNAYDYVNEDGIRIHKYGIHIFHTSNQRVIDWLSKFTEWTDYKHKALVKHSDGEFYTFPVNRETKERVGEENVLDIFFRPYVKKMWDLTIEELDPSILKRVPIRDDDVDLYFPNDTFQKMPKDGYVKIFENMLDHENISVILNTEFTKSMEDDYDHVFNSMAIDEYYDYCYGELPYRSIKFETITLPEERIYKTSQVVFTTWSGPTKVVEWKNFPNHGDNPSKTTLTYEYPCDYKENNMERYYPVKDVLGTNTKRYKEYKNIPNDKVSFIGRCGTYQYLDMHQVVNQSLIYVEKFIETMQNNLMQE